MTETITHIVLFKYKTDISWQAFEIHFEQFMDLKQKSISKKTGRPLIKSLKAGVSSAFIRTSRGMLTLWHRQEPLLGTLQQRNDPWLCPRIWKPRRTRLLSYSRAGPSWVFEKCSPFNVIAIGDPSCYQQIDLCYREDSLVVDIKDGVLFGPTAKRPLGENEYLGSCHCNSVTWTVKLGVAEHVLCHCRTCQQLGGGPYSCNQIVPKEALKIFTGSPKVYTYTGASGKRCGSKLQRNYLLTD
jgi:hypothetical protein